ncbi:hypothetical protein V2G26_011705 [Clonostachys chloroleuca]
MQTTAPITIEAREHILRREIHLLLQQPSNAVCLALGSRSRKEAIGSIKMGLWEDRRTPGIPSPEIIFSFMWSRRCLATRGPVQSGSRKITPRRRREPSLNLAGWWAWWWVPIDFQHLSKALS